MKKITFFLLGILFLLASCQPDEIVPPTTPPEVGILVDYQPTVAPITGSVDGFITNESGDAVQGAQVKLGNKTTVTNEDGHFVFLNAEMNQSGTLIQVTHAGYFDGSRRFLPADEGVDRVYVQLLQKLFDQSFDGATGGSISIPGGTGTIDFPANSIVAANGDVYTGIVEAAIKYLDPTAASTSHQMPGDLFGVTKDIEERGLSTFGMLNVELEDGNGNPLNIGENASVTITMPVPASMQGDAPTTLPRWYYNEAYGVWVEDSEATLTNGAYVGEVTHFTWWADGTTRDLATMKITLEDQNGDRLAHYPIRLTSSNSSSRVSYSNSLGFVHGHVPEKKTLVAEILICNSVVSTQNIGPYQPGFVNSETLTVDVSSFPRTELAGIAACNGAPINNSMLVVSHGVFVDYFYYETSALNWDRIHCSSSPNYSIKVVNLATAEESQPVPVTSGIVNNIGVIDACQTSLSEYLIVNYDGNSYHFANDSLNLQKFASGETRIGAYDFLTTEFIGILFSFDGLTAGSYPGLLNDVDFGVNRGSTNFDGDGQMPNFDIITFTSDHIVGSFSGTIVDSNGNTIPISATFDFHY